MRRMAVIVVSMLLPLGISPGLLALEQIPGEFEETVVCENENGLSEPIYIWGTYRIQLQYVEAGDHVPHVREVPPSIQVAHPHHRLQRRLGHWARRGRALHPHPAHRCAESFR